MMGVDFFRQSMSPIGSIASLHLDRAVVTLEYKMTRGGSGMTSKAFKALMISIFMLNSTFVVGECRHADVTGQNKCLVAEEEARRP